jgi:2-amino-4-hydroxy-6-hydroxymethyldihydropteridine diphosphokinase
MTPVLPHMAVLGLGANLGNPITALRDAIARLSTHPQTADWQVSPFYRTAPIGSDAAQPDYINAVASCRTDLAPEAMMNWLLDIERQFGRDRSHEISRNAPRTLDLDLLIYDALSMHTSLLTLPHPRLHQRAFVLRPLLDLMPDIRLAALGRLDTYLPLVSDQAIERLPD